MQRLTAKDARDILSIKEASFDRTLNLVRGTCDTAIKDASKLGKHTINFEVPQRIWGREIYDRGVMGSKLAKQLFEDGFDVSGTTVRLTISWNPPSTENDNLVSAAPPHVATGASGRGRRGGKRSFNVKLI